MREAKRAAIVTGGGQGIGKAIALKFLQNDIRVVIAEIDEEAGRETEAEFQSQGEIRFIRCDVSSENQVKSVIAQTIEFFDQLDILVNNAGIGISKPPEALTLAEWNRVMGVNLTGAFLCAKHATPHLRKTGGCIINIASTRALMSEANTEAYSATKGGTVALTHALAVSLGPPVRVNCISPGWIDVSGWKKAGLREQEELREVDHKQHPAGRVGHPFDIASLTLFLANPENKFITGQNFIVDGGMTRKMIYEE